MLSLWSTMILGLLLGLRHATEPDHVVAVTTLVAQEKRPIAAAKLGFLWGIGHTAALVVAGGAIVLFRVVVPPRVGLALELCVAIMLLVLGLTSIRRALRNEPARISAMTATRPLLVGLMHGLAGSGALGLLALPAIDRPLLAIGYLAVLGLGTIVGMLALTATMGVPIALATRRFARAHRYIVLGSGIASVLFGTVLAHRIGFVEGLLTR
jgi:high-affinity nickel-transport protein